MAHGPVDYRVELQLDFRTWTDVTGDVTGRVQVCRGRQDPQDPPRPSTAQFTLLNPTGTYTPGNPAGAGLSEKIPVRITAGRTTPSSVRFYGWVASLEITSTDLATGEVAVEAVDRLGLLAGRRLRHEWIEQGSHWSEISSPAYPSEWWPLNDPGTPNRLTNITHPTNPAHVIPDRGGQGNWASTPVDTLSLGSGIELRPPADRHGPVISGTITVPRPLEGGTWFRTEEKAPFSLSPDTLYILTLTDDHDEVVLTVKLQNDAGKTLMVACSSDLSCSPVHSGMVPNDGNWHHLYWRWNTSWTDLWIDETTNFMYLPDVDCRKARKFTLGGDSRSTLAPGRNSNCARIAFTGMGVRAGPNLLGMSEDYADPLATDTTQNRWIDLAKYAGDHWIARFAGEEERRIAVVDHEGDPLSDALIEVAVAAGGDVTGTTDGSLELARADALRPPTPTLTIDCAEDLDGGPRTGLEISHDSQGSPSRVTATYPGGTATWISPQENPRLRRDAQIRTAAGTWTGAYELASAHAARARGTVISQVTIDLAGAVHDRWEPFTRLRPWDRVRLTGTPPHLGRTRTDLWATGWTENYTPDSTTVTLHTTPADDPVRTRVETTTSRVGVQDPATARITGGTCLATTATGTIVITTDEPWTTDPTAYPTDLDWAGEAITVRSPQNHSSPQTLPVIARGACGTLPRTHPAGQPVDVWKAARTGP
jgi:hypothetical protein